MAKKITDYTIEELDKIIRDKNEDLRNIRFNVAGATYKKM